MAELNPQDPVIWSRIMLGGYGWTSLIPGLVEGSRSGLITITVLSSDGEPIQRHVKPKNVRLAGPTDAQIKPRHWGWELYRPLRETGCEALQRSVEAALTLPGWQERRAS